MRKMIVAFGEIIYGFQGKLLSRLLLSIWLDDGYESALKSGSVYFEFLGARGPSRPRRKSSA
jgi:hypothetical protein